MGYKWLWVLRDQFGRKFRFSSGPNLWGMGGYTFMAYGRYGLESFDCTCHNKEVYARLELIRFTR